MSEPPENSAAGPFLESKTNSGEPETNRKPSGGSTERLEPHSKPTSHSAPRTKPQNESLFKLWWGETLWLLVACALLVAIYLVLKRYNSEKQPSWRYGLNLSTAVAIAATIIRVCLMGAVESTISQLKWKQYRRPRSLQQLAMFDSASRGPWGSALLLAKLRELTIVQLGCLVTIFSIAITPFAQQAIKTEPCEKPSLQTPPPAIRLAKPVTMDALLERGGDLNFVTKSAIVNSIVNPDQPRSLGLLAHCDTGNCNFPRRGEIEYTSLGLCAACFNATGYVRMNFSDPLQAYIEVPNSIGIRVHTFAEMRMVLGIRENPNSLAWLDPSIDARLKPALESSIANWTFLTTTHAGCKWEMTHDAERHLSPSKCDHLAFHTADGHWTGTNFLSTACVFYPCAKHYTAQVQAGQLTETLVSERPAILVDKPDKISYYAIDSFCTINNVRMNLTTVREIIHSSDGDQGSEELTVNLLGKATDIPSDCYSTMAGSYVGALSQFLAEVLQGNCQNVILDDFTFARTCDSEKADVIKENHYWWLAALSNGGNATFESVLKTIQSVADTATDQMRHWTGGNQSQHRFVYGDMTEFSVCTHFSPEWLLMPAGLLLLGLVLTAVTVLGKGSDVESVPVWKDSILPLVLTGSPDDSVVYAGRVGELEKAAGKLEAVLQQKDGRWALVVEHGPVREPRA